MNESFGLCLKSVYFCQHVVELLEWVRQLRNRLKLSDLITYCFRGSSSIWCTWDSTVNGCHRSCDWHSSTSCSWKELLLHRWPNSTHHWRHHIPGFSYIEMVGLHSFLSLPFPSPSQCVSARIYEIQRSRSGLSNIISTSISGCFSCSSSLKIRLPCCCCSQFISSKTLIIVSKIRNLVDKIWHFIQSCKPFSNTLSFCFFSLRLI